ncbi:GNAT family N-acetyltransferase [Kribbella qitaiheensis]|uniref:GNAT family N-acetyltransferase n=1 Tax=Kribbella qitaiheensis TaxID=1544730 RepID=UPI00360E50AA
MDVPRLDLGHVTLRELSEADLPTISQAADDPYIELLSGLVPGDADSAKAYLRRQALRAERDLGLSLAITETATDRAVGQIGLWLRAVAPDGSTGYLEEAHGRAALGYWILPAERRKGFATTALNALSTWALALDDIERLEVFIEPANKPSWRAAERAGYHREGTLRSWQKIGDSRRDMYLYSRLPEDAGEDMAVGR